MEDMVTYGCEWIPISPTHGPLAVAPPHLRANGGSSKDARTQSRCLPRGGSEDEAVAASSRPCGGQDVVDVVMTTNKRVRSSGPFRRESMVRKGGDQRIE